MEQEISYWQLVKEYHGCPGFHSVDFFRKVRDKKYKEENGIPADEETEFIDKMSRLLEDDFDAYLVRRGLDPLKVVPDREKG
jgi:hypothetical protein